MSTSKLYVGNLPPETTEEEMRELFGSFGEVEEVAVFNKPGGDSGFAFVHFDKLTDADAALEALDNTEFHKYTISVQVSRTKGHGYGRGSGPPRPPGMRGPPPSYRDRSYRSDYRESSGYRYGGGRDSHRDSYRERSYHDYYNGRDRGRYGGSDYYDKYSSSGSSRYSSSRHDRGERDYYDDYGGRSKYSDYRSRSPVSSRDYYKSDRDYDRGYREDYREESSRRRW